MRLQMPVCRSSRHEGNHARTGQDASFAALASLNLSLLLLFSFSSHVIHEQLPHLLLFYVHINPFFLQEDKNK